MCNFLGITPNELFLEFITNAESTSDIYLTNQFRKMSKSSKNAIKDIIIYLDRRYGK